MNFRPFALSAAIILSGSAAFASGQEDALKAYGECADIRDDPSRLACYDSVSSRAKAPAQPTPVATETPVPAPTVAASAPAEQESWFGRNIGSIFSAGQQPTPEKPGSEQPAAPVAATTPAATTPAPVTAATPAAAEQESWFGRNVESIFGTEPAEQTTPEKFGADQIPAPQTAQAPQPQELDSITAKVSDVAFTPFGKFIVFLDNGQIWRQLQGDSDRAHFKKSPKDNTVTISRGALGSYNLTINGSARVFKVTRVK